MRTKMVAQTVTEPDAASGNFPSTNSNCIIHTVNITYSKKDDEVSSPK